MELTLEEAVRGVTKEIRIPTLEECDVCHGSGAKAGTQPQTCPTCHGSGQVQMRQGFFSIQQTCPHCHGTGRVRSDDSLALALLREVEEEGAAPRASLVQAAQAHGHDARKA